MRREYDIIKGWAGGTNQGIGGSDFIGRPIVWKPIFGDGAGWG